VTRRAAGTTTVAIVEDDANTREVFRTILEHDGYRVVEACDGPAAVKLVMAERPDVVLLDLGLPGLDGASVVEQIRADPATASVRIIVVTATVQDDARKWALHCGCYDYIEKPVELRVLTAVVERCLRAA
jgi:DNA-binding response OmpR family regulator